MRSGKQQPFFRCVHRPHAKMHLARMTWDKHPATSPPPRRHGHGRTKCAHLRARRTQHRHGRWFKHRAFDGASVDPLGILENATEGKTRAMRHWKFTMTMPPFPRTTSDVPRRGHATRPGRQTSRPGPSPTVVVLAARRLRRRPEFKEAMDTLTPGRQREYNEHIRLAKQSQQSRLARSCPWSWTARDSTTSTDDFPLGTSRRTSAWPARAVWMAGTSSSSARPTLVGRTNYGTFLLIGTHSSGLFRRERRLIPNRLRFALPGNRCRVPRGSCFRPHPRGHLDLHRVLEPQLPRRLCRLERREQLQLFDVANREFRLRASSTSSSFTLLNPNAAALVTFVLNKTRAIRG